MNLRVNSFSWSLLGLALLLSFGIAFKVGEWEQEQLQGEFAALAERSTDLLQGKLRQNLAILQSIRSFYASSREVEREEFRIFVERALAQHPEMVFLQWVARVPAADRDSFEESVRREGYPGFQITEQDPRGRPVRAAAREEYFPIHYGEPLETARAVLGFDLGSERARREALELARDTGKPVATPWIPLLVSGPQDPMGFLVFLPIYRNGVPHGTLQERRENLAGFALAVYRVGALMGASLKGWEEGKIEMYLWQEGGRGEKDQAYEYGPAGDVSWMSEGYEGHRRGAPKITWRGEIHVGGQRWTLTAHPAAGYLSGQHRGLARAALAAGVLAALLLFGMVHNVTAHAEEVNRLVEKRTEQLSLQIEERRWLEADLQKKTEQLVQSNTELAHREQLMRGFIEGAPDPIIVLDVDGRIRSVNFSVQTVFGYSDKELVGKHLAESGALSKSSRPNALKEFSLVLAGAERKPFELVIVAKNGSHLVFEVNPRLIQAGGRASGVLVTFRDVTERNRLEGQIRQKAFELAGTNEELEKRESVMRSLLEDLTGSKERLEQTSRQVEAANKRLQEMAALKDEFVAKVSHELRTPLTSVKEGLNLMLDGALGGTTAEQVDFLKTMDGDIDRLTELINNMLDISKIESGRMRLVRRRTALTEIVQSTVRSYRAIAPGREIVLDFREAPEVFIDGNRILQVMGNLLSNAVKYGREGGKITFGVGPAGKEVLVWVEDEGEGIAPEEIPKLFQKFSQVGKRGAQQSRGTGLGLVVCKELVELHGGRIEVSSRVGEGTRFTLRLPAYSDELAVRESFRELREQEPDADTLGVGLVALQVGGASNGAGPPRQELTKVAEEVRRRLHHADIVLDVEPNWVVALAATDTAGMEAIVNRLRGSLPGVEGYRFGTALYPADGKDGPALFEQARRVSP